MGEKLFDDLARALAEPMPRRRALRVLGTTLALVLVPGARPRAARAGLALGSPCKPFQRRCTKGKAGNYRDYCCGSRGLSGEFWYCGGDDNGYTCINKCVFTGQEAGTAAWAPCGNFGICCHPSTLCKKGQCVPCSRTETCGQNKCCKSETCCRTDVDSFCCPKGQDCCGRKCCRADQHCCSQGNHCCSNKTTCCGDSACCKTNELCKQGTRCVPIRS